MKPFPKGARVLFIGDSITAESYWESFVADYYHRQCPERGVSFFPCGIAGGDCLSALLYLREEALIFGATHAVIMLGTNDLRMGLYEEGRSETSELLAERERAIADYEHRLTALGDALQDIGGVKNLCFLTSIPYDEQMVCAEPNHAVGGTLRRLAEAAGRVAARFAADYYDLQADMRALLSGLYAAESGLSLVREDRTHPTPMGYSAMARFFLRAQSFDVAEPTVSSVTEGTALLALSPEGNRFYEAARAWQELFTAEWLIGRYAPDQRPESRIRFAADYEAARPRLPAWYGENPVFRELSTCLAARLPQKAALETALRKAAQRLAGGTAEVDLD